MSKSFIFAREIIFGQLLWTFGDFLLVTLVTKQLLLFLARWTPGLFCLSLAFEALVGHHPGPLLKLAIRSLFSSIFVFLMQLTVNKFDWIRTADLWCREATALPTEPQPLPCTFILLCFEPESLR